MFYLDISKLLRSIREEKFFALNKREVRNNY